MTISTIPQSLLDALAAYDDATNEIIRPLLKDIASHKTPDIVYHYTNDAGLRGILESGQLWLSDIFSLNDPSELRHGFSHVIEILKLKTAAASPLVRLYVDNFDIFSRVGLPVSANYFVCSFSTDGDDLGQWRAYADDGRGYALGFCGNELEAAFLIPDATGKQPGSTFSVNYDDARARQLHEQLVDGMISLISAPDDFDMDLACTAAWLKKLSLSLSLPVLETALYFKHEAYKNEKEFRFLQVYRARSPVPDVKIRYRAYEMIRYRTFDWLSHSPTALKRIMIGPAAERDKAARFAQDCAAAFYKGSIDFVPSKIPYRAK